VAEEVGLENVPVIAPACHDTGSAVAAVPAVGRNFAYISSGTWSLLGTEVKEPVITPQSLDYNFTNEGGVCGTFRFLKNIMGLWLIQECRNEWQRRGMSLSFEEMSRLAGEAEPFRSLIEPNADVFVAPGNMPERIATFCREHGQPVPETPGQTLRCALESLALRYRRTLDEIEQITGQPIEVLHLVGGGSKNDVLNQFTANAVQRQVVTGPVEATALGNIAAQAMATGELASLADARDAIRRSTETQVWRPQQEAAWKSAYERYRRLFR
jgi:sugar (pentulose or hexulose) kinase